jgi:hypothetical protein
MEIIVFEETEKMINTYWDLIGKRKVVGRKCYKQDVST